MFCKHLTYMSLIHISWRKLLVSQQNKFAEAFHVPASALHWYAAYHDADTHPHIHMMLWTDQETVLKRDAVVKLRSVMTNSIFQAELENLYIRKDAAYKDVTGAARETMRRIVDQLETVENPPESIRQKLMELALDPYAVPANYWSVPANTIQNRGPLCVITTHYGRFLRA